jgi:hypothetical protein
MTGHLALNADPLSVMHAAPKQYVDRRVLKAGDTMSGFLTLHALPVNPLHAATKQYVDEVVSGGTPGQGTYVLRAGDTMTGQLTTPRLDITAGGSLRGDGAYTYLYGPTGLANFLAGGADACNYHRNARHLFQAADQVTNILDMSAGNVGVTGNLNVSNQFTSNNAPLIINKGFYVADQTASMRFGWLANNLYVQMNESSPFTMIWSSFNAGGSGANPGYMRLPNTFIMQWGIIGGSGSDMWVNFPTVFPAAPLGVVCTIDSENVALAPGEAKLCSISNVSTASFLAHPRNVNHGGTVSTSISIMRWIAIGW